MSLEGGTDYTIAARSGSGITLYDANGTGLGTTDRTVLDYRARAVGTYYIQVAHNGSKPATIGLNVYETWLLDQTGTIDSCMQGEAWNAILEPSIRSGIDLPKHASLGSALAGLMCFRT
ncbi:outer membrane receptor protein, partial [Paenibacillus popilliae ATCC 14706]